MLNWERVVFLPSKSLYRKWELFCFSRPLIAIKGDYKFVTVDNDESSQGLNFHIVIQICKLPKWKIPRLDTIEVFKIFLRKNVLKNYHP